MKHLKIAAQSALALLVSGTMTVGCSTLEFHPRGSSYPATAKRSPGPPAHAPAHGYRHKHPTHNVGMTYDANIGVYAVDKHADVYFHDGLYFHWTRSSWHVSATVGDWRLATASVVPKGLKGKYKQAKKR